IRGLVRACGDQENSVLAASKGWIDPARLHYWSRENESPGQAEVWVELATGITPVGTTCSIPGADGISLAHMRGGRLAEELVPMNEVVRIVPSRLRQVSEVAL